MNNDARTIGETNALTAMDQSHEYEGKEYRAAAAYLVNTVDTARELGALPEAAVESFLRCQELHADRVTVPVYPKDLKVGMWVEISKELFRVEDILTEKSPDGNTEIRVRHVIDGHRLRIHRRDSLGWLFVVVR